MTIALIPSTILTSSPLPVDEAELHEALRDALDDARGAADDLADAVVACPANATVRALHDEAADRRNVIDAEYTAVVLASPRALGAPRPCR